MAETVYALGLGSSDLRIVRVRISLVARSPFIGERVKELTKLLSGNAGPARDREVAEVRRAISDEIKKVAEGFRAAGAHSFDQIYAAMLISSAMTRSTKSREEVEISVAALTTELVMREFDKELPGID